MKKTIIDGHETWWAVCCQHECSSVYWGPYFDDDEWLEREMSSGCEYAHFKARYVPEHAPTRFGNNTPLSAEDAGVDLGPVIEWVREHETKARQHPNYRKPNRSSDAHERAEKVLTEAVRR